MSQDRIDELEEKISRYRRAYYNDDPIVSDRVYDALEDELRLLSPESPALEGVGAAPSQDTKWDKKPHRFPMTSLNKINDPDEIFDWAKSSQPESEHDCTLGPGKFAWSEKLDGISLSLNYKDGVLFEALTRGDGLTGEDIIENVLMMQGVLLELPLMLTGSIRGEIILTHDKFEEHFSDKSNPRNAASGIAKREDREKALACQHLTVKVYDATFEQIDIRDEPHKFKVLKDLGFMVPNYGYAKDVEGLREVYQKYESGLREELNYDIDGLVIRWSDMEAYRGAGERSGNPHGAIALKFANAGATTTLREVKWQVGPTGRITPVAVFDPINLVGAEVQRASLYNKSYIEDLDLSIGDEILVVRANDVIPRVVEVVEEKGGAQVLKDGQIVTCPSCGAEADENGKYLVCTNVLECEAHVSGRIKMWIDSLNILDWGEFVIEALAENGHVSGIVDLYELDVETIATLENSNGAVVGEKTARKLLKRLSDNSEVTFDTFIGGLGISGCRKKTAKKLMKGGFDTYNSLLSASIDDLMEVDGVADALASSIFEGIRSHEDTARALIDRGHIKIKEASGPLKGLTFCITGSLSKPRKHIERDIVEAGGSMKGVSKSLDYLVLNDLESNSSKAKKARKYGVNLITEAGLKEMMG